MKNRIPTKPNRYAVYDDAHNFLRHEYHERADEPTEVGTPINKATLLSDETAAKYPQGTDTVDRALNTLVPNIGDIKTSARTDLGDLWLLCNSDVFDPSAYPELGNVLAPSFTGRWFQNTKTVVPLPPGTADFLHKTMVGDTALCLFSSGSNLMVLTGKIGDNTWTFYDTGITGTSGAAKITKCGSNYIIATATASSTILTVWTSASLAGPYTGTTVSTGNNADSIRIELAFSSESIAYIAIETYSRWVSPNRQARLFASRDYGKTWSHAHTSSPIGADDAVYTTDGAASGSDVFWTVFWGSGSGTNNKCGLIYSAAGEYHDITLSIGSNGGAYVGIVGNKAFVMSSYKGRGIVDRTTGVYTPNEKIPTHGEKVVGKEGLYYFTSAGSRVTRTDLAALTEEKDIPCDLCYFNQYELFESVQVQRTSTVKYNAMTYMLPLITLDGAYAYIKAKE